jgi:alpha-L-rhamnosidase
MILAQIEEWFHAGVAGIGVTADGLVFKPKPVGNFTWARGTYETRQGTARSSWTKKGGRFTLSVTVPANTTAEAWVPAGSRASGRATLQRVDGAYAVFTVPSGTHHFTASAT